MEAKYFLSSALEQEVGLGIYGVKQLQFSLELLYTTIWKPKIQEYWGSHHNFPLAPTQFDNIVAWEPLTQAVAGLPPAKRCWRWKFLTSCSSVCSQLHAHRHPSSPYCPLCNSFVEKALHVLSCNSPGALSTSQGCLRLLLFLAWAGATPNPFKFLADLCPALQAQAELRWDSFLIGWWTPM